MSYNKNVWKRKDRITKEKLNHMEDGIHDAHDKIEGTINELSSQIKDITNYNIKNEDNKTLKDLQEKAQNAYTKMNLVNSKLKMLEENLKVQNQVYDRLEKTRESLKSKMEEIRTIKTQLEMKASFTETMKKYSINVEDHNSDFNVDEIIKNVDVEFDAINS